MCILNIIKQIPPEVKPQINLSTVIVGDFNTLLLPIYRSSQKKKRKTSRMKS